MSLFTGPAHQLGIWVYLSLAMLVMVEGPVATLLGAVAASEGYLHPLLVFLSASTGNLLADSAWYFLGYHGKIEWLIRYGRWVGISREQILTLENKIKSDYLKILFIAKLTLGFIIPTLISIGLARIRFSRWFGILFLGECIWTGSLVMAGYYFGKYVHTLEVGLQFIAIGGMILFMVVLIRFWTRRKKAEPEEDE